MARRRPRGAGSCRILSCRRNDTHSRPCRISARGNHQSTLGRGGRDMRMLSTEGLKGGGSIRPIGSAVFDMLAAIRPEALRAPRRCLPKTWKAVVGGSRLAGIAPQFCVIASQVPPITWASPKPRSPPAWAFARDDDERVFPSHRRRGGQCGGCCRVAWSMLSRLDSNDRAAPEVYTIAAE
jgi:hypothetical protein